MIVVLSHSEWLSLTPTFVLVAVVTTVNTNASCSAESHKRGFPVHLDLERTDDPNQLLGYVKQFNLTPTTAARVTVWFKDDILQAALNDQPALFVDFLSGDLSWRAEKGGGEAILKAVRGRRLLRKDNEQFFVLDATGGFARDAFILASHGINVRVYERHPMVGALLADGVRRLQHSMGGSKFPMDVRFEDSTREIRRLEMLKKKDNFTGTGHRRIPDVVYLDPMFPRQKNKARSKKDMQFLQEVCPHQDEEGERLLLLAALNVAANRVVVKRPMKAPFLANLKTGTAVKSADYRFDIYSPHVKYTSC